MASDPQTELRLSRLENDSTALYELIGEVRTTQQEHSLRFDGIDFRLDGMDSRFDGIDSRLDGMDSRFDGIDGSLVGLQATLAEVLRRLPDSA
jgi:hypothetical protein